MSIFLFSFFFWEGSSADTVKSIFVIYEFMVLIDGNSLKIEEVVRVARKNESVELSEESTKNMEKNRLDLEKILKSGKIVYGVNTGFGDLVNIKIDERSLFDLQKNLIRSHSSGVGDALPKEVVRAAMLIRANTLLKGYSGVRKDTVELLVEMLNNDIVPVVPSKGSVGASGDLAPLAHVALAMMGEGDVIYLGKVRKAKDVFEELKIKPLEPKEKEGVALINGTSFMSAIGALSIHDSSKIIKNAVVAFSLSLEALSGTEDAYREDILGLRSHPGQIRIGRSIRKIIEGSEIIKHSKRIQDAYSLRCTPQVIGPALETYSFAKEIIEREINSVTDNPIVIDRAYSGGNFHGEYVAFALDFLGIALSEIGNISERRSFRLLDSKLSGLPAFLANDPGLNSGLMIAQYTAASLVSENKILSHPAVVDSIPTSADQEDHVSMGMTSALKLMNIVKNVKYIISIEYLISSQALEFRQHNMGKGTGIAYETIRKNVKAYEKDRPPYSDIEKIYSMIENDEIINKIEEKIGDLL